MKTFSNTARPFWDETLTSWLARLAQEGFVGEDELRTCFSRFAQTVDGELDQLSGCDGFLAALPVGLRRGVRGAFELPNLDLTPVDHSSLYCSRCIELDISAMRTPGWRASWRIQGACVCCKHDRPVLLRRLEHLRFSIFNKAWLAFEEYTSSPASRLDVDFALVGPIGRDLKIRNQKLLHLLARVQRWYQEKVCFELEPHLHLEAARFLLYVWLWEGEQNTRASGFARQYTHPLRQQERNVAPHRGKTLDVLFETVDVKHAAVAFWLLGVAYGIISEQEAQFIKSATHSATLVFPTNRFEIQFASKACFATETLHLIQKEARVALSEVSFRQIKWMLT